MFVYVIGLLLLLAAASDPIIQPEAASLPNSIFGGITSIKKLHFTHVMKCGGSTLDSMLQVWRYNHKTNLTSLESYRQDKPSSLSKEKFWLIVLRKPLDRVISHYWQVKPWEHHPNGGAHAGCKAAATKGFSQYMKGCLYSRNFMSRYFLSSPDVNGFVRQLDNYNLVVPLENLQQGILLLHLYVGMTVEDILFVNQKVYHNPKLTLSPEEIAAVEKSNAIDAMVYKAAQLSWAKRYENLTTSAVFAEQLSNYVSLLAQYQREAEPYQEQDCFTCHETNCSLPRRHLAAATQYVSHYNSKEKPATLINTSQRHTPVRMYPSRVIKRPASKTKRPPIPLEQQCHYIIASKLAQHKRRFCENNIKCKTNNLLAS